MTLSVTNLSAVELASAIKSEQSSGKPTYVVFYASLLDGRSWCGDCREAEPYVNKKFGERDDDVRIVYAGQRHEFKGVPNQWKEAPFSISKLPTVVKVKGDEWTYLVEEDVYNQAKLDAFVQ